MKKVIVSGANGFIGKALVKELLMHNIDVIALVRDINNHSLDYHESLTIYPFDLEEVEELKKYLVKEGVDTFFHFAWAGTSGKDRSNIELQLNNVVWSTECIKLAKEIGASRFIHAGSIMEIETIKVGLTDGSKPSLSYIYGVGKLASHMICKSVAADIGIDFICAMVTNAYGIGEISERLINTTIRKCINQEVPQFTSGTQNYDFIYIDDVARAFRLIGEKGKPFNDYIIGSSEPKPLKQFLMELQESIAPNLKFEFGNIPFTGVNLDIEDFDWQKTEKEIGFKSEVSFKEGCKRTRDWWLEEEKKVD